MAARGVDSTTALHGGSDGRYILVVKDRIPVSQLALIETCRRAGGSPGVKGERQVPEQGRQEKGGWLDYVSMSTTSNRASPPDESITYLVLAHTIRTSALPSCCLHNAHLHDRQHTPHTLWPATAGTRTRTRTSGNGLRVPIPEKGPLSYGNTLGHKNTILAAGGTSHRQQTQSPPV